MTPTCAPDAPSHGDGGGRQPASRSASTAPPTKPARPCRMADPPVHASKKARAAGAPPDAPTALRARTRTLLTPTGGLSTPGAESLDPASAGQPPSGSTASANPPAEGPRVRHDRRRGRCREDGVDLLAGPPEVVLLPGEALDLGVGAQARRRARRARRCLPRPRRGSPLGRGQISARWSMIARVGKMPTNRTRGRRRTCWETTRRTRRSDRLTRMAPGADRRQRVAAPVGRAPRPARSSMRSSWLYLATRSDRAGAPVLICPQPVATARSAMVVSSVSPDGGSSPRCSRLRWASSTASRVSVRVPIWLTLTRIELATPASMPRASRSTLVTKRSSPTSCTRPPSWRGERGPAVPVLLGHAVLDRHDRVAVAEVGEPRGHLRRATASGPRRRCRRLPSA